MNTKQLIVELAKNTSIVYLEDAGKPYLQFSLYDEVSEDDYGYEYCVGILDIKGTEEIYDLSTKPVQTVIKKENCPESLRELFDKFDVFHSIDTNDFVSLVKEEISLDKIYLNDY